MISICRHMWKVTALQASTTATINVRDLRKTFLVAMTLGIILGLGWGFGLAATSSDLVALTFTFQVIFSIFVGSQGVLIFVFHGLRNEDFRKFWKRQSQKPDFRFSSSFVKGNAATIERQTSLALSTLSRKKSDN